MNRGKWVFIFEAIGQQEADMVQSILEAHGIEVQAIRESGLPLFPLSLGQTAYMKFYVPKEKKAEARTLLKNIRGGENE